jgi:hypothetical protein
MIFSWIALTNGVVGEGRALARPLVQRPGIRILPKLMR